MDELADELSGTTIDGDVNKDIQMKSKSLKPVNRTASIINRSKMLILSDSESDDELELNNNNNNNNINSHNHPNNNNINNNNKNSKQLLSMKNFRISKPKNMNSNNNNWKSATNFMTNNNNNSSGTSVTPSFSANFNHYFSSTTTNNTTKGKRKRNSASEVNVGGGSSSSSLCSLGNMTTVSNNGLNPSAATTNHTILELGNLSNICKNLTKAKSDSMEVECDMFESSLSSNEDLTDDDDLSDECLTECNFDGDDEQSDFCDSNAPQNGSSDGRFRNRVYCHSRPKLEFKIPSRPANPFYTVDLDPSSSSSTMTVTNHHHSSSSSSPAITNLWKRRRPMH